ncbi:MAG: isoaspartyl peptidase/L-asparaginase [Gammaproteobacteria bacterium]|nr:isoaspartyl peptidase/L-asparaginase [Gammaproteobacteria bacterium]NNF61057.1 isoaspartyl peptidase/L-asparaginase [Gammaproteobacteria bacterium]NNM21430.1 isoaspartyl peptidase/L-asparaginase [Gammaproteobacteria bacterium]
MNTGILSVVRTILAAATIVLASGVSVAAEDNYGLVIHGGAGTIERKNLTPEAEEQIRAVLTDALHAGHRILAGGGDSVDAVVAAVTVMEDSPLFNAGRGSVYTWEETHELDASLMDGRDLGAGAVAAVRNVRNPIVLARRVMEDSPHVMLAGVGAEEFALESGVELVDNSWFNTDFRLQQLNKAKKAADPQAMLNPLDADDKFGTVGAVALDKSGNLAAATSTGGTTAKRWGRVGDSPIIGAGTYADNASCAVSATGHGEYFIRHAVAHDICARFAYQDTSLVAAADYVVMEKLVAAGGSGGVVAIDTKGNIAMPFNSEGMYRGYRLGAGNPVVLIFKED